MSAITTVPAATLDGFTVPSLARLAARLAHPAEKRSDLPKTAGLSVADISDASLRATVRSGLRVRRPAHAR